MQQHLEPSLEAALAPVSRARARARRSIRTGWLLGAVLVLGACGGGGGGSDGDGGGGGDGSGGDVLAGVEPPTGGSSGKPPIDPPPSGDFEITRGAIGTLVEGDEQALTIALGLERSDGHSRPVTFSVQAGSAGDADHLEASFTRAELAPGSDEGGLQVRLRIAPLPIQPQTRRLVLTASDGVDSDRLEIDVPVEPVAADDVYLLIGQSNMVGFSGEDTRESYEGGPDAPDPRVEQLVVTGNDQERFKSRDAFTGLANNVLAPALATAIDPLHVPPQEDGSKGERYIGLGLSFAKASLPETTRSIVLVPAAWSGSSFCANDNGPVGNWNAGPVDSPALGNSLLFERAVTRANAALEESGGILRGILWHQGESDANETCGPLYAANLDRLVGELRQRIVPDRRGAEARTADANVPFVAGTMSRGIDPRGDFSTYPASKQTIDDATRALPQRVAHTGVSLHDDLTPAGGYDCGNESCIHFGPAALREMGTRYAGALRIAAEETSATTGVSTE